MLLYSYLFRTYHIPECNSITCAERGQFGCGLEMLREFSLFERYPAVLLDFVDCLDGLGGNRRIFAGGKGVKYV